ncbi:MAG: aspartyl protease family protein [Flavobacteriaceae bacterium]|nr:aspartyl protease family protein [Flavobacteriaceae bacterium]
MNFAENINRMKQIITTLSLVFIISVHLNAQIAEIPFELKDDLILLKVNINDDHEYKTFIFDTGATSDLLDSTTADKLGLKANYKTDVSGASGAKSYDIILYQKLTLQNKIEIDSTHLVLTDLTRLKNKLERDFDGIIGYSLLKKYITKIDYENQKILLYNKIENIDTKGYKTINFKFENGIPIPQFDISITLRNGDTYTNKILFDSGAGLTLLINTPYNENHKLSKKAGKSLISKSENLHGESISEEIAIQSMNIRGYEFDEMVIGIAHDKEGVSSYENYLGLLGAKVISRFNIVLDYSTFTLYIKPNKAFSKSFTFPVSGIKLKQINGNILIDRAEETSSAYKKGIRKGDKLISINNDSSGDITVYRDLLTKENEKVCLTIINSEGKTKKIELKLKRLL